MLDNKDRINSKKELKDWLTYELYDRYGKKNTVADFIKDLFMIGESSILRSHIIILRKTEYYINTGKKIRALVYKLKLSKFQNKYSMHIPVNCCGRGLKIMHVGPVLMNEKVSVGENCSFHINTALVAGGTNDDAPTLEAGVIVGIGAVVLGNVNIAQNVAIGANAVVNKNIFESNIAVAGVPAQKVSNKGSLEWNKKVKYK